MWSSTKLWARDLFIEYLHLFCQILYNFCQRLFTSTCALPSDRLNVRGLSRRFLYCFDRDLLFLSYGTSFIPFPGFAIYGRVYMLVSPYFIYCYFFVGGSSTETDNPASLSSKPSQNLETACLRAYLSGKILKAFTASHNSI